MDDFFSDSQNNFDSNQWTEKLWLDYIKRSEAEIERIAALYEKNRSANFDFEKIAAIAGWPIVYNNFEAISGDIPEFSKEPLTLINYPIYIVTRAIIRSLESNVEKLINASNPQALKVWSMAKAIYQISNLLTIAINSTDLGEDMLAHSIYKSTIASINKALAEIENFECSEEDSIKAIHEKAVAAIFDLRQICLNLS